MLEELMTRFGLSVDVHHAAPPYMGADPVVFVQLSAVATSEVLTFPVRPAVVITPVVAFAHVLAIALLGMGDFAPCRGSRESARALDVALGTVGFIRLVADLYEVAPFWRDAIPDCVDLWAREPD